MISNLQLKTESLEKDKLMSLIETECSSLKDQLSKAETDHKISIAEHEKKFLQLSEEMGSKNSEVHNSKNFSF